MYICRPFSRIGLFIVLTFGVTAMLYGCQTMSTMMPPNPNTSVSFSSQILPIFASNCASCHQSGGFANQQGITMFLTAADAYNTTVNKLSEQDPSLTRIIPGNSAQSLLYLKISSTTPPVGSRMPLFALPLSNSDITLIKDWIDQGALNN